MYTHKKENSFFSIVFLVLRNIQNAKSYTQVYFKLHTKTFLNPESAWFYAFKYPSLTHTADIIMTRLVKLPIITLQS